ncbi:MAG: hypothetical protein O3B24_08505 [Verrucomicrobia bacterium]|nr:hypothetical protein [Verrucomicrobiota bacterium]
MAKPFKFRYVNEIVGTFVLLIVAMLIAGIVLVGHGKEWFEPLDRYHIDFPEEGSLGVQKGAVVEILGTSVGSVERITVEDDGHMAGIIAVKGDFIRFVRSDSMAIVKKRYGVAGDAFIEITRGLGDALTSTSRITIQKDTELIEMMEDLLKQVRETTVPALEELRKTIVEYGQLATDLRNPDEPLMKLLRNLEQLTAGLQRGEGAAGTVLRDPQMADDLKDILDTINATLNDLKQTTAQLPAMAKTVGAEVEDLPGLMLQTQETIRESERLIEGIQRHWLIRKHVPQPQSSSLIPSAEVRTP